MTRLSHEVTHAPHAHSDKGAVYHASRRQRPNGGTGRGAEHHRDDVVPPEHDGSARGLYPRGAGPIPAGGSMQTRQLTNRVTAGETATARVAEWQTYPA